MVCWFLDVSFHVTFLRIIVILETDTVVFGAQNLTFGGLVPPLLHPGWPCDDPGAPGSTRKEVLGSRLWFLSIWGGFRDLILRAFRRPLTNFCVFFHACFQVTFANDFRVWIWTSWAPETRIWCEKCCKNQLFPEVWILMISGSTFSVFRVPWEQLFWCLVPWRQAWKLSVFQGHLGDPEWHHRIREYTGWRQKWCFGPGPKTYQLSSGHNLS